MRVHEAKPLISVCLFVALGDTVVAPGVPALKRLADSSLPERQDSGVTITITGVITLRWAVAVKLQCNSEITV